MLRGEALEEVVKEVVEVVEALGIYRRPLKACLVNFRCKICPAVEACLLARGYDIRRIRIPSTLSPLYGRLQGALA